MFGSWRLLLAFEVVVFHLLSIPIIGHYAVLSFFVLSGFLMTTIMHRTYGYTLKGRGAYALNRVLRLYPNFWFAVAVSLITIAVFGAAEVQSYRHVMQLPQTGTQWFENLSMIYLDWIPLTVEPRLAPPTWALTTEIFFYALIGIGLSRSRVLTLLWLYVSAIFVLAVITLDWGSVWIYGAISGGSFPFALGATVFHYRESIEAWLDKVKVGVVAVLFGRWGFMFGMLVLYALGFRDEGFVEFGNQVNALISALVVVRLFSIRFEGAAERWDRLLGDFSYPVYLLHWQAGAIGAFLVFGTAERGASVDGLIAFIVAMPILLVLSAVCVFGIDPLVQKVRNSVRRHAARFGEQETRAVSAANPP